MSPEPRRAVFSVLLLCACGDDAAGGDTEDSSTGGGSSSAETTTSTSTSTSTSGTSASTSDGSSTGSSTSGTSDLDGSTSGATTTGVPSTCEAEPAAPDQGTYESECAGSSPGQTCPLTCLDGTTATEDAQCLEDGTWTEPGCDDPFDQDDDGVRRYPWGADLDDDGDGALTYLLGGADYDDADAKAQALAGDGTFALGQTYALGPNAGPTGVAIGDWDFDGNVDIATTNQNNDTLSILLGAGDGTFSVSSIVLPKEAGGGRIKPADLDGDGTLDLVATFGCRVFMGVGDGSFTNADDAIGDGGCNALEVVDADDDDRLDVLSYTYGETGQLRAYLATDDGFDVVDTPAPNISAFAPGFIDGDGTIDVGLIEFGNRSAQTFIGAGDGSFTLTDVMDDAFLYNAIAIPRDLDGDGDADLLIGDFINDHIAWVQTDGTGQLGGSATIAIDGPAADGLFAGDLDGDGSEDIVYAAQEAGFGVAMGSGGGAFDAATSYDVGDGEFGIAGADFDADGRLDFAVINISSNDLVILLGQ